MVRRVTHSHTRKKSSRENTQEGTTWKWILCKHIAVSHKIHLSPFHSPTSSFAPVYPPRCESEQIQNRMRMINLCHFILSHSSGWQLEKWAFPPPPPPFPLTHSVPSLGDAAAVAAAKNARWPFLILMAHCYPFNRIFQLWLLQFHVWHFAYMQNVSAHEMLMEHEYAWIYVNCELMCVCVHFMQLWWTRNGQHQIRSKRKQRKTDNGTKKLVCVCVCVCVSVSLATKIQRQ